MSDETLTREELEAEIISLREHIYELENIVEASQLLNKNETSVILRMNIHGTILFANAFASQYFNYGEDSFLGADFVGTLKPDTEESREELEVLINNITSHPEEYIVVEDQNMSSDGTPIWLSWTFRGLIGKDGQVSEILCIGSDITRRKFIEDELERIAKTDLSTGFSTRIDFSKKFEDERLRRQQMGTPLSLILCGIDNFDELSLTLDDEMVQGIFENLSISVKSILRHSDAVGRWSDNRIIIMLPETILKGAAIVAQKIQSLVAKKPIAYEGSTIDLTLSCSVVQYDKDLSIGPTVNHLEAYLETLQKESTNAIETFSLI